MLGLKKIFTRSTCIYKTVQHIFNIFEHKLNSDLIIYALCSKKTMLIVNFKWKNQLKIKNLVELHSVFKIVSTFSNLTFSTVANPESPKRSANFVCRSGDLGNLNFLSLVRRDSIASLENFCSIPWFGSW